MNKLLKVSALLVLAVPAFLAADSCSTNSCSTSSSCSSSSNGEQTDFSGHTFFSIRPQFQSQDPEKIAFFRNDRMYYDCDGWGGAFQMAFFGGETRRGKDLAKWFMPCGKTELLVRQGTDFVDGTFTPRDVDANQFNIETVEGDFESRITMCPEQSVFGIGFDWKQMFTCKDDGTMGFWGEVSLPVTRVRNKINFKETIINDGGGEAGTGAPANMTEAFVAESLQFARIDNDSDKCLFEEWGVAGVEIKAGYNFMETDCYHIDAWIGVVAPAGNTPNGRRVFEPIVGYNGHTGLMIGGSYGYDCWQTECGMWRVEADLVSKYFLKNCERRTVDVCDKQWSRYMKVYASQEDALAGIDNATQAANIFTLNMDVTPRFTFNYSTAVIYESDSGFGAEIGYNFWARQSEKICVKNFPTEAAFADVTESQINPARTIAYQNELATPYGAADNYAPITLEDLNLNSAAHVAAMTQTFYGALGYDYDICDWQGWANIGAEYEYSTNNAGLNRWTVFGKLGVAF